MTTWLKKELNEEVKSGQSETLTVNDVETGLILVVGRSNVVMVGKWP